MAARDDERAGEDEGEASPAGGLLGDPGRRVAQSESLAGRRVALVDLGEIERPAGDSTRAGGLREALRADPELVAHAGLGGAALALAPFAASGVETEPAFAIAVGEAVGRGVPTAARVTLTARAPLRPGVTEAQVGGTFAFGLTELLDGLVLFGRAQAPVHLVVRADGVWARPGEERTGALAARARAALEGGDAALVVGPAADAGLPFANIASVGSGEAPSFVGRGGLGATLRAAGVLSITVEVKGPGASREAGPLTAALGRSPRLVERARSGTLELAAHRATAPLERGGGATRHGCRGCPTPCGWVLRVEGEGEPRRAVGRFAALQGFAASGDAAGCLERCNELGMDARTAARLVLDLGREGDLPGVLDELVVDGSAAHSAARAVSGQDDREPGSVVHGADLAARVGVLASPRGPEPLRSLSVFGLQPSVELPGLVVSGDEAADAGRLARWHGAFASAVDVAGFCAFSASALVADGVMDVDELARAIAPSGGWGDGEDGALSMLAAGERHLRLHAALGGGLRQGEDLDPAMRRAVEAHDEGLDPLVGATSHRGAAAGATPAAVVEVRATGRLGARLGGGDEGIVTVPGRGATVLELLEDLAARHPEAAPLLLSGAGRPIPAVLRGERALAPGSALAAGDSVELVLVIPGG